MGAQGVRPEAAGPAPDLYRSDSTRYTAQNKTLQLHMATLAVQLLGVQGQNQPGLLADIGCGSGLSSVALAGKTPAWLGTDITREMLQLAAAAPACRGRGVQSDFSQGLPLRPACLDGAISVSAVQWLCSAADPAAAISRCFGALRRSLVPGAPAALQVYPEDDEQAQQLVAGARAAGLHAGFFVAFPHPTPAKKFYLLLRCPCDGGGGSVQQGSHLSQHCCNLAWPKSGSCLLSWARELEQRQPHAPASGLQPALDRLQREHAAAGKRVLRVLRRAESLAQADSAGKGSSSSSSSQPAAPNRAIDDLVVHAELEVAEPQLLPCGGTIFVQLAAEAAELSPSGEPASGIDPALLEQRGAVAELQAQGGAAAGKRNSGGGPPAPPAPSLQQYAAGAAAAAQQLLAGAPAAAGAGGGAGCALPLHMLVKGASAEEVLAHAHHSPLQPFAAPAAGSTDKARQFMRLEPLQLAAAQEQPAPRLQEQQRQPLAAVLHVNKAAQHLALRFSCNPLAAPACTQCGAGGAGASSCGSPACCSHVARCLRAFCAAEGACVVALDARLFPERADTTWLLFVPGLQQRDRAQVAAALQRHFA